VTCASGSRKVFPASLLAASLLAVLREGGRLLAEGSMSAGDLARFAVQVSQKLPGTHERGTWQLRQQNGVQMPIAHRL
jgi:hypothetical protein